MLQECLIRDYQIIFSVENFRKYGQKKRYIDIRKTSHKIEQSGVASSEKELLSMKQMPSVKLKESAKNAKQKPTVKS